MKFKSLIWNVNGANALEKRKLFHYLKKKIYIKEDIICLQEIHIRRLKYLIYIHFLCHREWKTNGVVSYINPQLQTELILTNEYGKYVGVEVNLHDAKKVNLHELGTYAWNEDKIKIYKGVLDKLIDIMYKNWCLTGH